jgi:hypothetical protein
VFAPAPAHALLGNIGPANPAGWSAPAVPRNTGDATESSAPAPAQLLPTQPTWFNWAVGQNAAISGTWQDEFYLDGELIQLVTRSNDMFAARTWYALNTGPSFVPGGRHTVEIWADRLWQTNEDYLFRSDNDWTAQYVWQPQPLASGSVATTKPPQGEGGWANCNAFAFTRTPGTAWVASAGAAGSQDAFPVRVFDDYVNSTNGLTHEIARSERSGGLTNFVVGAAVGNATTLYPAVLRNPGTPAQWANLAVMDAAGRQSATGIATWPSVNLPAGAAAQVFETHLTAGTGEAITLTRFMGASDLEVLIYPPDVVVASRDQALAVSTPRDGDDEYDDLFLAPGMTGTYLVVVARVDQAHLGEASGYALELGSTGAVDAPSAFADVALAAAPSPATGPMRLSFALARSARVTLTIFDLGGRTVRRLIDEPLAAGLHARAWDGLDDRGRAVASGRYFARLTAGTRTETLALIRLRQGK